MRFKTHGVHEHDVLYASPELIAAKHRHEWPEASSRGDEPEMSSRRHPLEREIQTMSPIFRSTNLGVTTPPLHDREIYLAGALKDSRDRALAGNLVGLSAPKKHRPQILGPQRG